ncbi:NAD(P)-binding domain-containing protein [Saccharopolyspora sp. 6T]|uniref:NADPH-dependent F420 reductase n=1 Tax=Saccharopolyspora sp. 6T TaxID=2877238 RepID=UPI001CD72663|nr:NAD(P)-binding domain-containing protein [Saccharopolyspora sp. 6T]MCA1188493.1 NAD(P)-binding domain-containing protein [Saccharopolyspora sp. 6T]
MKIAVIGTGGVDRTVAAALAGLGHEVVVGTRNVENTLAGTEPDGFGNPPYAQWQQDHREIRLLPFAEAGAFGEVVLNATNGANSLEALEAVGSANLAGKVLLDLALPLDLSQGMPPTLTVANTDSLGEQIQRAFPEAKVVKSLNSVAFPVMVDPSRVPGEHGLFVAGNDEDAKHVVRGLLVGFGWPAGSIIDLGGISGARGAEMYSRLYFTLAGVLETFDFNIAVVRA